MTDTTYLPGEWYGWRLSGRHLVSPHGDRLTRERLDGLVWRDHLEVQRAGYASRREAEHGHQRAHRTVRVKVIVVELADYRLHGLAAS